MERGPEWRKVAVKVVAIFGNDTVKPGVNLPVKSYCRRWRMSCAERLNR
jgi:hypothetical protein